MTPRTPAPLVGLDALKTHVSDGFTAAADGYDADGSEFFQRTGAWLVDTVRIPRGAWVLDVGCGKGAASLPAARAAGPEGHVTAIDLAAPMLAHAEDRARRAGVSNVTFRDGDAEDPGTYPGWGPGSFDTILAANALQFLPRPERAARHWRALLTPHGRAGIVWSLAQDPQWEPVLAAIDAYVPDGVPAFAAFMRRPPFANTVTLQDMLTGCGFANVTTVTRAFTMTYLSPEHWWEVYRSQGPWALSWRHIPPARLRDALPDAFAVLEPMRGPDGILTRTLTFACTVASKGSW